MGEVLTSRVTLRQLEAFAAVADAGSFTAGAARLGRSQPTVSKEVQALERTLRRQLVDRSPRRTGLTAAGRQLLAQVRRVLAEAAELERVAAAPTARQAVRVRLACTPSVSNRLLPVLLQRVEGGLPGHEIVVKEVETGEVEDLVEQGRVDLGLCHYPRHTPATRIDVLGDDELVLVGQRPVLAAITDPGDLRALSATPLLLWPRENHPEYFDSLVSVCRARGLSPLILIGADRLSGARSYLLTQGRAVSIVPRDAAPALDSALASLPLGPDARAPLGAILPTAPRRAALAIVELVRQLRAQPS
ncbi:LysR family transcriptional regulator [Buchananella hordeovulneris]|uniref:HTH lysR-type domain-containing protein n=1 Tax=Buchananella hordeovulneris TaxID=52770 RepID=A0A1Q5PUG1_9ACTO|nr:LysR family transcriptional regulator [Buchananella hordeovulneris]MDO5080539.1 LysR family transcriptional regulator [Buchananella hordeovulneris]OKL51204.1 hypothetical protein BSZ40_08975 [Buchananella hordeovulneris]RRD44400.1 LysR family transcriptional regulator [Buchananella hordeovulneris]RRD49487.1 LysR family transcriptional regulator [Buchananella hordeovulneris]